MEGMDRMQEGYYFAARGDHRKSDIASVPWVAP
jgi:hypothetical protein